MLVIQGATPRRCRHLDFIATAAAVQRLLGIFSVLDHQPYRNLAGHSCTTQGTRIDLTRYREWFLGGSNVLGTFQVPCFVWLHMLCDHEREIDACQQVQTDIAPGDPTILESYKGRVG